NDKTPYGQGLADEAEKELRAKGATIVQSEGIDSQERDFTAVITKIQTLKPDAIYFGAVYGQAGPFVKQLRDKGITTPIVGGDGYDSEDLIKLAGSGASDIYFTTIAPPVEVVPAAKTASVNFQKAFGTALQGYGVMAYDAAKVVLEGILNASKAAGGKVPTRAQVETSIRSGSYPDLLTGPVKFDKNGDRTTAKMYVIAVKDAKRSTAGTINVIRK
ncbi:branched-chain amino acid ABC transporter substrate-binding protein, partial [Deinococcus sp.]|uniref:branched-chain amino acid ABC transporter substrate-binding protein n=1 Tax=Deinococcus sp. TaxID=47478 RepID=UPI0025BEBD6F